MVCVTRVWAGVDNAWEQYKPEARKMLGISPDSPASGSIMKVDTADRCRVGLADRRAARSPCPFFK